MLPVLITFEGKGMVFAPAHIGHGLACPCYCHDTKFGDVQLKRFCEMLREGHTNQERNLYGVKK